MTTLIKRVEQLERSAGMNANETPRVIVVRYVSPHHKPGILTGYKVDDQFIARPAAESESDFKVRVIAEHSGGWPARPDILVLYERRAEA